MNYIFKYFPLLYINIFCKNNYFKLFTNISYFTYILFNNRYSILDTILIYKIKLTKYFYPEEDFKLIKVYLYKNLNDYIIVTKFFEDYNIVNIEKKIIFDLYYQYKLCFDNIDDIRLKIFYSYKNKSYIMYYDFNNKYSIPYPPYSDKILENYKKDIILPKYYIEKGKKYFYYLFSVESKDIYSIKINNNINEDLKLYFEMIKSPFNDYGILYECYIKLKWILAENDIDLNNFESFYLKFLNLYFDEEILDLKEHTIELNKADLNKYLMSDRMKYILQLKNSDIN